MKLFVRQWNGKAASCGVLTASAKKVLAKMKGGRPPEATLGPDTFEVDGDSTIRGATKQEKLNKQNEQRHPLHQDCQPCRGKRGPQRKASQQASLGIQTIAGVACNFLGKLQT